MSNLKLQVPVGTTDYLPGEYSQKQRIIDLLNKEFYLNGYEPIQTPSFEYYDVFQYDSVPYVQENMIKFFDGKGRILALRPDMTGPIARMAATKLNYSDEIIRLCYSGSVYGFENGVQRTETTQSGVEMIGKSGAEGDAEIIALAVKCMLLSELEDFKIDIGQVGYFKGLTKQADLSEEDAERIRALIDSKNSVELDYELSHLQSDEKTKRSLLELPGLFGGIEILDKAEKLTDNGECLKSLDNLRQVYEILRDYGYENYISIDLGLLNNFNYYSGIIMRGIAEGVGRPILSGGRYDCLLREFCSFAGSESAGAPATGFAVSIEDLLKALEFKGKLKYDRDKITVIKCTPEKRSEAIKYAEELRNCGRRIIFDTHNFNYDTDLYDIIQYN